MDSIRLAVGVAVKLGLELGATLGTVAVIAGVLVAIAASSPRARANRAKLRRRRQAEARFGPRAGTELNLDVAAPGHGTGLLRPWRYVPAGRVGDEF